MGGGMEKEMKDPEDVEVEEHVESGVWGGRRRVRGTVWRSRSSCSATHGTSQARSEAWGGRGLGGWVEERETKVL